jgi:hypothetical protein
MTRTRQSLDGIWQFKFQQGLPDQPDDTATWNEINVPAPWQAQFDDLREAAGTGWYRREIAIPSDWYDCPIILHIGAAFHFTSLWVNGQHIADHADGYLPLDCDISSALEPGKVNTLLIRVVSPSDDETQFPGMTFSSLAHGKQSWYGQLGGIWQSVWIERRSPIHITYVHVQPNAHTGSVMCNIELNRPADEGYILHGQIADDASSRHIPPNTQQVKLQLTVEQHQLWSPDEPNLYQLHLSLRDNNSQQVDTLQRTIGFRTIEAKDGLLVLNGEPFYMRGALDQDYYPDAIATPPSVAFLEDQMLKAKAMGLNCLRYHIKLADPRYYEVADRIGILLWVDYPNWSRLTKTTQEKVRQGMQAMLRRDHHHPSIGIWTIINENWGTDLVGNARHRAWLKDTYHWLKAEDPTRLVVDNSPCVPNFHVQSDINDYHYYSAIPDNTPMWDRFVTGFADGSFPTYSPHGDAVQSGDEPRIVSEFGNWGLPDTDQLQNVDGTEPWWFETGDEWPEGTVYPHGVKKRFQRWGLNAVFGSWQHFIEQTQWQQFRALTYEIDSIRRNPALAGYVLTEFTDVHWEANGLLDMNRTPKAYFEKMVAISGETTLLPIVKQRAVWSGAETEVAVGVSHLSGDALHGAQLVLSLDGVDLMSVTLSRVAFNTAYTERFTLHIPVVDQPTDVTYTLKLLAESGEIITQRDVVLHVYPHIKPDRVIWTPSQGLARWLEKMGYTVAKELQASSLILADILTPEVSKHVQNGCHLLLLAETTEAIPTKSRDPLVIEPFFPYARVVRREHTAWEGNWASTFAWSAVPGLSKSPLLLDHRFQQVMPEHILTGFSQRDFQSRVIAGLFAGWIHKPVALAGLRYYGEGQALLSTFALSTEGNVDDPVAHYLLHGLMQSVSS